MRMTAYERHDSSAQPSRDERIKQAVIDDIDNHGDATNEALGTQATLSILVDRNWQLGQELTELLSKAVANPSDKRDQELGKCIRKIAYDYIAAAVEDLV